MQSSSGRSLFSGLVMQLFLVLVGFFLWWMQDVARTNREQIDALCRAHHEFRREIDSVGFRLRVLEEQLRLLKKAPPPSVNYGGPLE